MTITMEMREDGSYLMSLDASPMLPALRAAMYGYIEQLCKDNGISVEDYEESTGKTLEETVDEALEAFDLNDINQTVEGVYEEANGQVIWDKGAGETRGLYTGDTLVFSLESFGEVGGYLFQMLYYFTVTNLVLCVFNLLPIPPLDGYHVLNDLVLKRRQLFANPQTARIASGG